MMDLADLFGLKKEAQSLLLQAEQACKEEFIQADENAAFNQARVLRAFSALRIDATHFLPSTGYGYGDRGREGLEALFALVMGTEAAIVRPQLASGTHALSMSLFGLLRPGERLLYGSGMPYDTLEPTIGLVEAQGSLQEYGIGFAKTALLDDGGLDIPAIETALRQDKSIAVLALQRSAGYGWRRPLTLGEIEKAIKAAKAIRPDIYVMVDNCYGEFTAPYEPGALGADAVVGSLIKNPGGGLAPTGAYITGSERAIARIEARLTAPGIGRECGSYEAGYRAFYHGLFLAPTVTAAAIKTAILFAEAFSQLGYEVNPQPVFAGRDIIQAIRFGDRQRLIDFCRAIQKAAPVDSMAVPEPDDMPGYESPVIMAAGAFVQGASIELSADAPIREPYIGYLQGGLTYEHGRIGCLYALDAML